MSPRRLPSRRRRRTEGTECTERSPAFADSPSVCRSGGRRNPAVDLARRGRSWHTSPPFFLRRIVARQLGDDPGLQLLAANVLSVWQFRMQRWLRMLGAWRSGRRYTRRAAIGHCLAAGAGCLSAFVSGCATPQWGPQGPIWQPEPCPNPLIVAGAHRDLVWAQVVDVVDDYFRIAREEPVRGTDVLTEGHLETYPLVGATILEPWRGDSANTYERWESTLQSIRRICFVRVTPLPQGHAVRISVMKELEDLGAASPGAGSALFVQNDNALERFEDTIGPTPPTRGWIPLGNGAARQ